MLDELRMGMIQRCRIEDRKSEEDITSAKRDCPTWEAEGPGQERLTLLLSLLLTLWLLLLTLLLPSIWLLQPTVLSLSIVLFLDLTSSRILSFSLVSKSKRYASLPEQAA